VATGRTLGSVESVKAVSEIYDTGRGEGGGKRMRAVQRPEAINTDRIRQGG